jgi:hypothetical protein
MKMQRQPRAPGHRRSRRARLAIAIAGGLIACPQLLACRQPQVHARSDDSPTAGPERRSTLAASRPGAIELEGDEVEVLLDVLPAAESEVEAALAAGGRLLLVVEGVRFSQPADGWHEIYLALPAGQSPSPDSPFFVGNFTVYALEGVSGRAHDYDVTSIVRALRRRGAWGPRLPVRFVPGVLRGGSLPAATPSSRSSIHVDRVLLCAER